MFIKFKYVMAGLIALVCVGLGVGFLVVGGGAWFALSDAPVESNFQETKPAEVAAPKIAKPRRQGLLGDPGGAPAKRKTPVDSSEVAKTLRGIKAANAKAQPNSKQKDAFKGEGWKINLYEETGDDHYDRAKIDKDRDGTPDEKWNWKGGRWEKDGGALIWDGGAWTDPKAAKEAPKVEERVEEKAAGDRDTALAKYAKRMLTETASGKKAKDITGGSGPKINLYDDDGDGKWDRGKVDTNRDDTWDQKWTVKGGVLERKIESSGEVSVFGDGAWTAKK